MNKSDLRIKLLKEKAKAKKLRELKLSCDNNQSFVIYKASENQDKKVNFIKKLSNYL